MPITLETMVQLSKLTSDIQSRIKAHPADKVTQAQFDKQYPLIIECLIEHNILYYVNSKPLISDLEYDQIFAYCVALEEKFPHFVSSESPTQKLVGQVQESFKKAEHKVPLLSLENSYNSKDIIDFDASITRMLAKHVVANGPVIASEAKQSPKTHKIASSSASADSSQGAEHMQLAYTVEPKFDGLSVELVYKDGSFVQAITRGDGTTGEDITENVKTLKTVPLKLHHASSVRELRVRGEILMPKSALERINRERISRGDAAFVNTRNAAAGSIKLLDTKETSKRGLICYVYDILFAEFAQEITTPQTHEDAFAIMKKLGLPIHPFFRICKGIQEVVSICESDNIHQAFHEEEIDFDGLVIKLNEYKLRENLGYTQHHPRRAIAYKYPAQQVVTQILSVDYQVGRTGVITPTANLEPVQVSGVTVSRVSLHNFDVIAEKDIHLGDYVRIQRSGEVIPYVVSVLKERREGKLQALKPPKTCPSCDHPIHHEDVYYICTNIHCPARLVEAVKRFVSKDCMYIEGIGESLALLLVEQGFVKSIADLYELEKPAVQMKLMAFPGIGAKKTAEIASQLAKSKHNPLRRLLNGLGINHVGKKTATLFFDALKQEFSSSVHLSVDQLTTYLTNEEFLSRIHGVGEETIAGLKAYFGLKTHQHILQKLHESGVQLLLSDEHAIPLQGTALQGKHFAITGTFGYKREQLTTFLQSYGASFDTDIKQTTDFLLAGDDASSKLAKAEKYGVTVYQGVEALLVAFPALQKPFSDQFVPETKKASAQSLF